MNVLANDQCPICYTPLSNEALQRQPNGKLSGQGGQRVTYCATGHGFHAGCAAMCLGLTNTACPMCRQPHRDGLDTDVANLLLEPHATQVENPASATDDQRRQAAAILGELAGSKEDGDLYVDALQNRVAITDVFPIYGGPPAVQVDLMKLMRALLKNHRANQDALHAAGGIAELFTRAMRLPLPPPSDPDGIALMRESLRALSHAVHDHKPNVEALQAAQGGIPMSVALLNALLAMPAPPMVPGEVGELLWHLCYFSSTHSAIEAA